MKIVNTLFSYYMFNSYFIDFICQKECVNGQNSLVIPYNLFEKTKKNQQFVIAFNSL